MTNPLISVIVPVYNRPEALRRTLVSVIEQTYSNIEVLIIDDGSNIDIYPVIEELNDNRISYYKLDHQNVNVARNYGIGKSKGEYIAMLDADDLWLENHVYECIKMVQSSQTDGLHGSLILKNMSIGKEQIATVRALRENETMIDYLLNSGYGVL